MRWSTVAWTSMAYLLLVGVCPVGDAVELGGDEHFELIKADLVHSGLVSNRDFWNDQPPGLTYLLAGVFSIFGASAFPARLLIVALTAAMLAAVQSTWRGMRLKGVLFALFLTGSPGFLMYSMSVMSDPAKIPLCIIGYGLAVWSIRRHSVALAVLSGLVFGGAVLVKFTAALYLPGILWAGWLELRNSNPGARRWLASGFLAGGAVWLPWFLWLLANHGDQLLFVHFSPNRSMETVFPQEHFFGWRHILMGLPLWLGGIGAVLLAVLGKIPVSRVAFPAAVLGLHLGMAFHHVPWWEYYLLDLWLALAWLSAETSGWCLPHLERLRKLRLNRGRERNLVRLQLAALVLVLVWLPVGSALDLFRSVTGLRESPRIPDSEIIAWLRENPPSEGEVMFTNDPIAAFHGGWRLPPNLVVLSLKRFWSGAMDSDRMVEEMRKAGVSLIYFDGPLDRVEIEQVKFAEESLGSSRALGNGTLFAGRGRL